MGDSRHSFNIGELGINLNFDAAETVTAEFTVDEAGTFPFYCVIYGHRSAGEEGILIVTE